MKSQRARWKKRDGSRVEQRDNDVTETPAVVGGKTRNHHGSSDFPMPLMTTLKHRIFVGNISYKVKYIILHLYVRKHNTVSYKASELGTTTSRDLQR